MSLAGLSATAYLCSHAFSATTRSPAADRSLGSVLHYWCVLLPEALLEASAVSIARHLKRRRRRRQLELLQHSISQQHTAMAADASPLLSLSPSTAASQSSSPSADVTSPPLDRSPLLANAAAAANSDTAQQPPQLAESSPTSGALSLKPALKHALRAAQTPASSMVPLAPIPMSKNSSSSTSSSSSMSHLHLMRDGSSGGGCVSMDALLRARSCASAAAQISPQSGTDKDGINASLGALAMVPSVSTLSKSAQIKRLESQVVLMHRKCDSLREMVKCLDRELRDSRESRFHIDRSIIERARHVDFEITWRDRKIQELEAKLHARADGCDENTDGYTSGNIEDPEAASYSSAPFGRYLLRDADRTRKTTPQSRHNHPATTSEMSEDDIQFVAEAGDDCDDSAAHTDSAEVDESSDAESDAPDEIALPLNSGSLLSDTLVATESDTESDADDVTVTAGSLSQRPANQWLKERCVARSAGSDEEDFGYGSEESASSRLHAKSIESFSTVAPSQVYQGIVSGLESSRIMIDLDGTASQYNAKPAECLHTVMDATLKYCEINGLWKSNDDLHGLFTHYRPLFSHYFNAEDDQCCLLAALEGFCVAVSSRRPYHLKLLMTLYQLEVVGNDAIQLWYDSERPSANSQDLRVLCKQFVDWLDEQASDEDDDDDEEEEEEEEDDKEEGEDGEERSMAVEEQADGDVEEGEEVDDEEE
ncbi:hypothetical protein BC831DRAFT_474594, partial [Entophlyctis helioformis]